MRRVNVESHRQEDVADIKGFPTTALYFGQAGWFGVTPDGRTLSTRNTAIDEIYAFDLEYK